MFDGGTGPRDVADADVPRRRARADGHERRGVVAGVADAGATFLAPIFDELAAVVCLSGTPQSHIGIVSREYQVPVRHGHRARWRPNPPTATQVEVDCSGPEGVLRQASS